MESSFLLTLHSHDTFSRFVVDVDIHFFYPHSSFLLLRLRSSDLELNRFNEAKYGKNRQQGSVQHKDGSKEVRQDSNLPVEAALRVQ